MLRLEAEAVLAGPCFEESALAGLVPFSSAVSVSEARPEELRLVDAAREGDRAAFAALYAAYTRMVHGILLARVPRADVDDLAQDVFLQAMERLRSLRDAGAFGGWLAAIARNRATDYLRCAPRTTELPDEVGTVDADHTDALAVLAVIQTLPDAYRETLVLRLVEGMTGPEIAARTGLTAGSVRVNLHRGMKQLRERLERRGPRE
jgi:RNA polymerase sigma-70 factor (ECF subfamily)